MSSSVSHKERAERYYAYNLEKAKERGNKIKKAFNFDNIKKGFYDELISYDEKLKKDKMELEAKKTNGFKELVYTNVKVPDVWKNKLSYQSDLYNTMNDDDFFVSYLGKGGSKMYILPEKKSKKNETSNPTFDNNNTISSTSYNTSFQQLKQKRNIQFNFNETLQSKQKPIFKSILKSPNRNKKKEESLEKENNINLEKKEIDEPNTYQNLVSNIAKENREVLGILEEYKQAFPIDLPKIIPVKKKIEKESEKKEPEEKSIRKKKGELTKAEVFKTTIYNNLLNKNIKIKKDEFTHINYYDNLIDKEIEITNPEIKRRLEDINFRGPFYPYCIIGRKKNMLFYKTMEHNQCVTLLKFLKKALVKSKIGIKVDKQDEDED